jgi:hypothetical protein
VAEARLAHWEEAYSLERGRPYWTNLKTGGVVWDNPHRRPPVGAAGPAARARTFEVENPLPEGELHRVGPEFGPALRLS